MGKDRDEGIVDAAQNTVRETTGALRGEGPWHSARGAVALGQLGGLSQQPKLPDR